MPGSMRRILLDQNIPFPLVRELTGHDVVHASQMAWGRLTNGDLPAAAQRDAFDIMITADRGIVHQQDHRNRKIALLILAGNRWPIVRRHLDAIRRAVDEVEPSGVRRVPFVHGNGRARQ